MIGSLISLLAGALLLGLLVRVAVAPAAWIALFCLLHGARLMPTWPGAIVLWLLLSAALAIGNRGILPAEGIAYFAIAAALGAVTSVPFIIDRWATARLGGLAATLVFPAAWVTAEFLRSRFTTAATWGSIAYTQHGFLPLMQIAAVTGIWGISFLIAWCASVVETAWSRGFDWRVQTPALACTAVMAAILVGGALRLAFAPTDRASIRIATVSRPPDFFVPGEATRIAEGRLSGLERPNVGEKLARLHDWFVDAVRREARGGARVVAWPETNLLVFAEDEQAFLARARRLAADEHVYLAMGLGTVHVGDRLPLENKLVLIDSVGTIIDAYEKSHPVQGWEEGIMRVGDGRLEVMATPIGHVSGAICFDADFPEFIRQAGRRAADLFILPANDWEAIKALHSQMAAFRAIENGVPIVRPAASGLSTAVDSWGRTLAVSDSFAPGDRTMTAQVPVGHVPTLYAKTGDIFAWLCVAALAVAVAGCMACASPSMTRVSAPVSAHADVTR